MVLTSENAHIVMGETLGIEILHRQWSSSPKSYFCNTNSGIDVEIEGPKQYCEHW